MIRLLPIISRNYYLTPRDFWGLTLDELAAYLDDMERVNEALSGN